MIKSKKYSDAHWELMKTKKWCSQATGELKKFCLSVYKKDEKKVLKLRKKELGY